MLSSPSAPERHAGCKVAVRCLLLPSSALPLHVILSLLPVCVHVSQVALLLAESFVAANHNIDEGDGLSDEVRLFCLFGKAYLRFDSRNLSTFRFHRLSLSFLP
jgi:hypothetical protein